MLARTYLGHSGPCCTPAQRVTIHPAQHGRLLAVCRANSASRSSSPRVPDGLRSSWRTELFQPGGNGSSSNGNSNGSHADSASTAYRTAYSINGNGYHADDGGYGASTSYADDSYGTHEAPAEHEEHGWSSRAWHADAEENGADGASPSGDADEADEADGGEGSGPSFFTDAFRDALKQALQRSPLYGSDPYLTAGSDNEEDIPPEPTENEVETMNQPIFTDSFRSALKQSLERQQTELDKYGGYGSDDEYTAVPYVPSGPPPREMSPMEEVITTALGSSQMTLRRLNMIKNEVEAAIEREARQVERLEFALSKVQSDLAYYKSLERMMEERNRQR
ncbi:hypothetical protein GPECTOR_270g701 [Gonium pectorale]|uniref:Uncharacterized protein n=1 Tax=Gonium pectorale TaxID=33097 RepID=A0A150FW66_GONPE|nr:hypothetical protein GPECTOR_270g701 [Gonium pectorale]|eukprot:KXZ41827.1 hypothetical protein GPECTOR_270g701 [Gonium pectorale]